MKLSIQQSLLFGMMGALGPVFAAPSPHFTPDLMAPTHPGNLAGWKTSSNSFHVYKALPLSMSCTEHGKPPREFSWSAEYIVNAMVGSVKAPSGSKGRYVSSMAFGTETVAFSFDVEDGVTDGKHKNIQRITVVNINKRDPHTDCQVLTRAMDLVTTFDGHITH